MVHKSGTTFGQTIEKIENDELNEKLPNHNNSINDNTSLTATETPSTNDEESRKIESKRKLRTSRRLNSTNFDLISLTSIDDESTIKSTTNDTAKNNHKYIDNSDAIETTIPRKPIRNRRYTITDCVSTTVTNDVGKCGSGTTTITSMKNRQPNRLTGGGSADELNNCILNCSVSLERLNESFVTTKATSDSEKDETVNGNKILCLYCERSFLSHKLYAKHIERIHESVSGRRLSTRTLNSGSTSTYPGCPFCNVGKIACLSNSELTALVIHQLSEHSEKYFACKDCMLRFPNRIQMQQHLNEQHKPISSSKRKTKNVQSPIDGQTTNTSSTDTQTHTELESTDASEHEPSLRSRLRRSIEQNKPSPTPLPRNNSRLLSSEETFLSRLGITQNRSPRSRKGAKNRRGCSSELFQLESTRSTRQNKGNKLTTNATNLNETIEFIPPKPTNSKNESIAIAFDEDFYESVNLNVKQNLCCYLDGKIESGPMTPNQICSVSDVPAVRSILVKSPLVVETEIHEATTISAFTAFPTLLTAQQYGVEIQAGKMKKPITKNSWKWKWDCVKKYKYVNEGGKIVKKVKQPMAGFRDLAKLDMWTQLTMRTRHELLPRQDSDLHGDDPLMAVGEIARDGKRRIIQQLNKILDTRVLPQINLEQNDQTIIKLEKSNEIKSSDECLKIAKNIETDVSKDVNFPSMLNLIKRDSTIDSTKQPIVLSGEWARPRCYICCGCGGRFSTVRMLEEHKTLKHPYVHSTHYEIVGKELLDGKLLRNFYIPSLALEHRQDGNNKITFPNVLCTEDSMDSITSYSMSLTKSESIDMDSNSRNSKVSVSSSATVTSITASPSVDDDENANISAEIKPETTTKCSKCDRECNGIFDLYRHMLDCSNDYAWLLAKKRNQGKYRYFGSRRRRQHRSASSNIRKAIKPKKEPESGETPPRKLKPEPTTPRPRPSDGNTYLFFFLSHKIIKFYLTCIFINNNLIFIFFSSFSFSAESIKRMLENLPAKRAVRQIFPNLTPTKPTIKFVQNAHGRNKLLTKQKKNIGNMRNFKILSASTTINKVATNLALRKKRTAENILKRRSSENLALRQTRSSNQINITSTEQSSNSVSNKTTSKNDAKPSPKSTTLKTNKQDIGAVLRMRTRAVVKKIANTFRNGNKTRLLRSISKKPNAENTKRNSNDRNVAKLQNKCNKFLRNLSFRKTNKATNDKIDAKKENDKADNKTETNKNEDTEQKNAKENFDCKQIEKKENVIENEKEKKEEKEITKSIDVAEKNVESSENKSATADVIASPPPKLKRKRSIKTIINDIRAKCQSKNTTPDEIPNILLPSINENKSQSDTVDIKSNSMLTENATIPSTALIEIPKIISMNDRIPSISITAPLTLILDEPLDLSRPRSMEFRTPTTSENSLNLISPALAMSRSNSSSMESISPRRRPRKLNDCIAKLQEKLGVPFIDQSTNVLNVLSPKSQTEITASGVIDLKSIECISISTNVKAIPTNDNKNEKIVQKNENEIEKPKVKDNGSQVKTSVSVKVNDEENDKTIDRKNVQSVTESLTIPLSDVSTVHVETNLEKNKVNSNETEKQKVNEKCATENVLLKIVSNETNIFTEQHKNLIVSVEKKNKNENLESNIEMPLGILEKVETNSTTTTMVEVNDIDGTRNLRKSPISKSKSSPIQTKATKKKPEKRTTKTIEQTEKVIELITNSTESNENTRDDEPKKHLTGIAGSIQSKDINSSNKNISLEEPKKPTKKNARRNNAKIEKNGPKVVVKAEKNEEATQIDETAKEDKIEPPKQVKITPQKKYNKKKAEIVSKLSEIEKPTVPEPKVVVEPQQIKSSPKGKKIPVEKSEKAAKSIVITKKSELNEESKPDISTVVEKEIEKTESVSESSTKHSEQITKVEQKKNVKELKKTQAKKKRNLKQETIVKPDFDSSEDELLPWDPETGFVQNTETKILCTPQPEPSAAPSPVSTTSSSRAFDSFVPKIKKKRKNELAQIIADQLLESFKSDKSRIDELKKIHDMSLSSSEDLSSSLSTTPTPRRKSKKIFENLEPKSRTQSPKAMAKSVKDKEKKSEEKPIESDESKKIEKEVAKPTKKAKTSKKVKEENAKSIFGAKNRCQIEIDVKECAKEENEKTVEKTIEENVTESLSPKEDSSPATITTSTNVFLGGYSDKLFSDVKSIPSPPILTNSLTSREPNPKSKAVFGESTFSHQNIRTNHLSNLIAANKKDDETKASPVKTNSLENLTLFDKINQLNATPRAPFMSPRWEANGDEKSEKSEKSEATAKQTALPEKKINLWSQEITKNDVGAKRRLVGAMTKKAKKLFGKSSKKLKKSLKSSMSSSSSTSSSSSYKICETQKKPLLRPSILSCNNRIESSEESKPIEKMTKSIDVFDSLKASDSHVQNSSNITGNPESKANTKRKNIDENPKLPIESDMNIAKIVIALEKSNRKETSTVNMNDAFLNDDNINKNAFKNVCETNAKCSFATDVLNDDSSQDTMISEIVNKIRENADRSESDDDLYLADVAKKNPSEEIELSESLMAKDFSALVSKVNDQLPDKIADNKEKSKLEPQQPEQNAEADESDDGDCNDDGESVYTTLSHDTSITSGGGKRKKRKKRSILSRNRRKKRSDSFLVPTNAHYCDLCKKSFRNQSSLTAHKATISHITKVSEQEFLDAKKLAESANNEIMDTKNAVSPRSVHETEAIVEIIETNIPAASTAPTVVRVSSFDESAILGKFTSNSARTSPTKSPSKSPSKSPFISSHNFEMISSPEQNSCFNSTPKHVSASLSVSNSRLTLSHEERLFYECCSMLKGSDRTTLSTEASANLITPKSNDQSTNIAHSAQSPRSHPSPRPGLPTMDAHNFSDISSDSNPAYSCPHVPSSSKTQKIFSLDGDELKRATEQKLLSPHKPSEIGTHKLKGSKSKHENAKSFSNSMTIVRNYPETFSDMGDSFPSSQDASESEHYAQTILERSNQMQETNLNSSLRSLNTSKIDDSGYGVTPIVLPEFAHLSKRYAIN